MVCFAGTVRERGFPVVPAAWSFVHLPGMCGLCAAITATDARTRQHTERCMQLDWAREFAPSNSFRATWVISRGITYSIMLCDKILLIYTRTSASVRLDTILILISRDFYRFVCMHFQTISTDDHLSMILSYV